MLNDRFDKKSIHIKCKRLSESLSKSNFLSPNIRDLMAIVWRVSDYRISLRCQKSAKERRAILFHYYFKEVGMQELITALGLHVDDVISYDMTPLSFKGRSEFAATDAGVQNPPDVGPQAQHAVGKELGDEVRRRVIARFAPVDVVLSGYYFWPPTHALFPFIE